MNQAVMTLTQGGEESWAVKLFRHSPLKQKKLAKILEAIGDTDGKLCLDIGSDNGVISLFLRQHGGHWTSCDLIPEAVKSIRDLVRERADQITEHSTPYRSEQFDLVVIVDVLEHIRSDREFVNDLYRILRPGGTLVVNVPNPKEGLLRALRNVIGQTDEAHGHVRPGYSPEALQALLRDGFDIEWSSSYSRCFSVFIDTVITGGLELLKRGKSKGKKGTLLTASDMKKLKRSFLVYSLLYPFIAAFVKLDNLFPFLHGNMLIVRARKKVRQGIAPANSELETRSVE